MQYVAAYQQRGDEALVTYDDTDQPLSLKEQWRGIVADSPYFHVYAPELQAYLTGYPRASLPGARDVIYWIRENYGPLGTVLSIVHAVIYQPPSKPDWTLVAQKHIYASHYYDASLAVASMLGAEEAGKPVTYLIYVNRSRGDLLKDARRRRRAGGSRPGSAASGGRWRRIRRRRRPSRRWGRSRASSRAPMPIASARRTDSAIAGRTHTGA